MAMSTRSSLFYMIEKIVLKLGLKGTKKTLQGKKGLECKGKLAGRRKRAKSFQKRKRGHER